MLSVSCLLCTMALPDVQASTEIQIARKEATGVILKMHGALKQLDTQFQSKQPENMASKKWIRAKLQHMAVADQLIRRVLVENTMSRDWPIGIKKSFVLFFFNLEYQQGQDSEALGYAQRNDLYQYRELKRLLSNSPLLNQTGWPTISMFGPHSDYHAFLVAQHGMDYDQSWQKKHLLPRLKRLASKNECSRLSYLWLKNTDLEFMQRLPDLMELEGGPWKNMIPEVRRLLRFFKAVPIIMQTDAIPLRP